jgi:hypothetical protein
MSNWLLNQDQSVSITTVNKTATNPATIIIIKLVNLIPADIFIPVCLPVLRRLLRDNKFNSAAINGSSINVTANIAIRNQLKLTFSNQVSGGTDMFSNCRINALIKNRNGIINNKREAAVSLLAFVKDFMFQIFIEVTHLAF